MTYTDGHYSPFRSHAVREHTAVAEKALGKRLPRGAQIHHIDEDKSNNSPGNLVICPSQEYHQLLHRRQKSFDACGKYDWLKCMFCKVHDDPTNIVTKTCLVNGVVIDRFEHKSCRNEYSRKHKLTVRSRSTR